jgi:hydroxyacylglutathione hydrolase
MEITSGIHRINGIKGANCYLVITNATTLVIDTGMPGNAEKIINYVKALGKNPSKIDYIILTHADIDHIGSALELKKLTGARIAIHAGDALILAGKEGFRPAPGLLGVLLKFMMPLLHFHKVEPDLIFKDYLEIEEIEVIHTPGHTDGSICLYLPKKVIFAGDALRSDQEGNIKPPSRKFSADTALAKASIIAISKLEFDILLPGHGAPVIGRASDRVKELLMHLK